MVEYIKSLYLGSSLILFVYWLIRNRKKAYKCLENRIELPENNNLKKIIDRSKKIEYLSFVDDEKYSKINVELMQNVIDFYKKYI